MKITGKVIIVALLLCSSVCAGHRPRQFGLSAPNTINRPPVRIVSAYNVTFPVNEGFLFVNNSYQHQSTKLTWTNDKLQILNPTSTMLASLEKQRSHILTDVTFDSNTLPDQQSWPVSADQMYRIRNTLKAGGVVMLSNANEPLCMEISTGGLEFLEALIVSPGSKRTELLDMAWSRADWSPDRNKTQWLCNFQPDEELAERAEGVVSHVRNVEKSNITVASAVQRFDSWTYPITVIAMIVFVVAIGSLLSARPQELVAVAETDTQVSIHRFLWLIAGMSVIDLVWTLLAHQAQQITEVNPIGSVLLADTGRVIVFKGLATALAIAILYRARQSIFARKACWWVCLTLALLMGRWILVSGVTA